MNIGWRVAYMTKYTIKMKTLRVLLWLSFHKMDWFATPACHFLFGGWQCKFRKHDLVPRMAFCWRCDEKWNTWEEAVAAR